MIDCKGKRYTLHEHTLFHDLPLFSSGHTYTVLTNVYQLPWKTYMHTLWRHYLRIACNLFYSAFPYKDVVRYMYQGSGKNQDALRSDILHT